MRIALVLLVACGPKLHEEQVPAKAGTRIAICGAYPYDPKHTGAVVIQPDGKPGEIVEFHGRSYNIHRSDCLVLDHPTIHWSIDGAKVFVGLGNSDAIGERSEHRISQLDALYVNDELLAIPQYDAVMRDTLWLADTDQPKQRALFEKITGTPPPSPVP